VCDADAEFGVSVAIGNGYIYDLVGCGGTRRPTSPYADEPRGAPRPRRAASASLLSTTVLLYTVYLYVADGVPDDGRDEHARLVAPTTLLALLLTV